MIGTHRGRCRLRELPRFAFGSAVRQPNGGLAIWDTVWYQDFAKAGMPISVCITCGKLYDLYGKKLPLPPGVSPWVVCLQELRQRHLTPDEWRAFLTDIQDIDVLREITVLIVTTRESPGLPQIRVLP